MSAYKPSIEELEMGPDSSDGYGGDDLEDYTEEELRAIQEEELRAIKRAERQCVVCGGIGHGPIDCKEESTWDVWIRTSQF